MPEIALEAIAAVIREELKPINESLAEQTQTLAQQSEILNRHTTALDGLAKDVKTLLDEKAITMHRFERLEHWAQQVGQHLGIKLEL